MELIFALHFGFCMPYVRMGDCLIVLYQHKGLPVKLDAARAERVDGIVFTTDPLRK
jgi:hypothetical protein